MHVLSTLIALANLACLCAWGYLDVYTPQLPMPWIGLAYLPVALVVYFGYAAMVTMTDEYISNAPLRAALSRKDGWLVTLCLVALLGPDPLVLFCRSKLPSLGSSLSKAGEQQLVFWAGALHFFQDVPVAVGNVLLHSKLGARWDTASQAMLVVSACSLSFNLIWHLYRVCTIQPDDDDPELGRSATPGLSPVRQKTLRKIDTSKYVGLAGQPVIGSVKSMYTA